MTDTPPPSRQRMIVGSLWETKEGGPHEQSADLLGLRHAKKYQTHEERRDDVRCRFMMFVESEVPDAVRELFELVGTEGMEPGLEKWSKERGLDADWVRDPVRKALEAEPPWDRLPPSAYMSIQMDDAKYLLAHPDGPGRLDEQPWLDPDGRETERLRELAKTNPPAIRPPQGLPPWKPYRESKAEYLSWVGQRTKELLRQAIEDTASREAARGQPSYLEAAPPDVIAAFAEGVAAAAERYCEAIEKVLERDFGQVPQDAIPTLEVQIYWAVMAQVAGKSLEAIEEEFDTAPGQVSKSVANVLEVIDLKSRIPRGRRKGSKNKIQKS